MITQSATPNSSLKNLFREYYYIHINSSEPTKQKPVIDDCCYDIIFFKELDSMLTYGSEKREALINHKLFTINQLPPPCSIRLGNSLTFFSIKLQPWVNAMFFSYIKQPGIIDISNKFPKLLMLHKTIMNQTSVDTLFNVVDDFYTQLELKLTNSMVFVKNVCEYIYDVKGIVSVDELCEKYQKTRQYLNRIFKKEVLYSLKKFIKTVRITELIKFKTNHKNVSLTILAYEFGYFDQPHFNRDFKNVCGVSPAVFFNHIPEFYLRH